MPLFSIPLSGLTASSTALSAISNNIANLNTVGYKQTRAMFRDLFYQTMGTSGSGDPIQVGAGSAIGSINSNFTPGSVEQSGVSTDVAITGDGFFIVQKDGVLAYTRAGDFSRDDNGFLVTSEGQQVLGYPSVGGLITTGQGLTPLDLGSGSVSPPNPTGYVQMRTNLDARTKVGDPAFSTPVNVYDSLGDIHNLKFTFDKTGANAWNYSITIPAADVGQTGSDVVVKTGALTFDGAGNLLTPAGDVTGIAITDFANGANDLTFTWKIYDGTSGSITQMAATSNTSSTSGDGYGSGSLVNFAIQSDGTIQGTFSNGKTALVGQIALANFANLQGLLRIGKNDYESTLASGAAVIGAPGTGGRGTVAGGALELSNVDIAHEFSQLIMAERGFQANARVVTTFDEITQETINLKR
jgi:flagellar hook protein FlgE